jgi:hypothetical protein
MASKARAPPPTQNPDLSAIYHERQAAEAWLAWALLCIGLRATRNPSHL